MSDVTFPFRYVDVHGVRYLRLDDVTTFIRELGGSEETDMHNRLQQAAERLLTEKKA